MCGFGGVFPIREEELYFDRTVFNRFHRNRGGTPPKGPHFQGNSFIDDLFLSCTRLSVFSEHNPPYFSLCGRYCGMFNGEIFNFKALTARFNSDNPVQSELSLITEMYAQLGNKAFANFEGQFCGVIYDRKQKKIVLYRDRLGLTPLHYCLHENRLLFSSYQRPILEIRGKNRINTWAKDSIIHTGYNIFTDSLFEGISEILPGTIVEFDHEGRISKEAYYRPEQQISENIHPDSEQIHEILKESLHLRIPGINFSLMLSSGIDSTLTAILLKEKGIFPGMISMDSTGEFSELPFLRQNLKHLYIEFPEIVTLSPQYLQDHMTQVIEAEEEPHGDLSFLSLWMLGEKLRDRGEIISFTGDFSDELFLGYEDLKSFLKCIRINLSDELAGQKEVREFLVSYIRKYLMTTDHEISRVLFRPDHTPEDFIEYASAYLLKTLNIDSRITIGKLCVLLYIYLLNLKNNAIKSDRTSMENGFEIRSIFHSTELMNYVLASDSRSLFSSQNSKYWLRKIISDRYPLVFKTKMMPTVPFDKWLHQYPLLSVHPDTCDPGHSLFLNHGELEKYLNIHKGRNANLYRELRLFYVLNLFENLDLKNSLYYSS